MCCFSTLTHQSCGHLDQCPDHNSIYQGHCNAVLIAKPLAFIHPSAVKSSSPSALCFVLPCGSSYKCYKKKNPFFLSVQRGEEAGQIAISRLGFSPMCHSECNCNVTLQGLHVGGRVVHHKREDCSQNTN